MDPDTLRFILWIMVIALLTASLPDDDDNCHP